MNSKLHLIYILLIPYFILIFTSCKFVDYSDFRNDSVIGIVDSVDNKYNSFVPNTDFIWVNGKKYSLSLNYYYNFTHYVQKGDSIYNETGRWDIFVYRIMNGRYSEKYFQGAQNSNLENNNMDTSLNINILIIVLIIFTIALSLRKIKVHERGVVFRLEKFFKIVEPGIVFVIPFIDKMIKVNLNDRLPGWYDLKEDELNEKVKEIVITDK